MDKLLDQEQINAMFRSARGDSAAAVVQPGPKLVVSECDLRRAAHLTKDQAKSVTSLHETACRNIAHAMGAYLRVVFEADVVSVEQLTYAEFLGRVPNVTYLCSLNVEPMNAIAVLQLDLSVAFPLIDILLGGEGKQANELREATEIEEELLAGVVKVIARELDAVWSTTGLRMSFDERQLPAAVQRLLPPVEKTLVVSFEFRIPQARGTMNLAFPAVVTNTLLRKLLRDSEIAAKRNVAPEAALREFLLECRFPLSLEIPNVPLSVEELLAVRPGSVLSLELPLQEPIPVAVGGQELFRARPVRTLHNRGAQVSKRLTSIVATEGEAHG